MFQDKTAFLEYPSLYGENKFDQVQMNFYLDRVRAQIDMIMFQNGREVGKFQAHVPQERLYEQYGIELMFAEEHHDRGIQYQIQVHGEFPQEKLN